jgi:hypothetical protein
VSGRESDFLVARPSTIEGISRILDLGGTLTEFNQSPTPAIADRIALRADWRAIGDDLRTVFSRSVNDVLLRVATRR